MSNYENPYAPSLGDSLLPDEQYNNGQLATLSERFAGAFIDGIIGLAAGFPIGMALGLGVGAVLGEGLVPNLVVQVLGGLVGIGLFLAIQGYFLATRSQTIGKMALGTKIVRDNGETIPFGELYTKRYLILQLVSIVPFVGGFVGLIDALLIFRSNRKCLHDDLAGTKVIKLR
jgi:uncharacterized RDD family membrane protein YckC